MGGPTPVNVPVQTADEIIKDLLGTAGIGGAILALQAAFPFLALPGISLIFGWIVTKIGTAIIASLAKFVDFKIIDWQTEAQNIEYQAAVTQLKQAQASGDPNALSKAKDNFKQTLGNLIHFNGS